MFLPFLGVVRVSGSLQRVPVQYKRRYRKLVPSTGTGKGAFPGRGTRSCCMYGYRVRRTGAGTGTTYDLSIPDYRVGTYSYFLLSTVAVELVLVNPPVRFFRSRQNRNRTAHRDRCWYRSADWSSPSTVGPGTPAAFLTSSPRSDENWRGVFLERPFQAVLRRTPRLVAVASVFEVDRNSEKLASCWQNGVRADLRIVETLFFCTLTTRSADPALLGFGASQGSSEQSLVCGSMSYQELLLRIERIEGRLGAVDDFGHALTLEENALIDLTSATKGVLLPMDASWVITSATLVFFMQLGFAQLEAGLVRNKNVLATYMKNIIDFILGAISALVFGYGIAYGEWPIMFQVDAWKFFFHLVFQATASTIVSGGCRPPCLRAASVLG